MNFKKNNYFNDFRTIRKYKNIFKITNTLESKILILKRKKPLKLY